MSVAVDVSHRERGLWAYSLYAAMLSAAGLPIYIFAPKFFVDTYGVSLTALGAVLFGLRLFDLVQDPVLGWLSDRLGAWRGTAMAMGAFVLAASMLGLFAVDPVGSPLGWFALTLAGVFSAFSFLTINFYAQGVARAGSVQGGHVRLAGWRETGGLIGVCVAAVLPTVLMGMVAAPFAVFAVWFSVLTLFGAVAMAPEWRHAAAAPAPTPFRALLSDPVTRRLLVLGLVNAAPLAVSSTLFLFFVESVLQAPEWQGPLLVVFFLSAALSSIGWSGLAERYGAKPVLMAAMGLAIVSFGFALLLGAGDVGLFVLICVATGVSIGADLTLLPALFAARMEAIAPSANAGFGLWAFVSKFTLAFAAVSLLAVLERGGFVAGGTSEPQALWLLTLLYAAVPCVLKLVAMALLWTTPLKES